MNSLRFIALTTAAAALSFAPMARADDWNKKTILTVKEAIQLPNVVLPAGTYTFKLLDSLSDRHIVQVFDGDGMHLVTTILAIPNYRLEPTGKSDFTFWEVPAGQPPAMRAWFYPGDNFGQEFVYPKNMSTQIASSAKTAVPTTTATKPEEYKSATIVATNENGTSTSLNSNAYTRSETAPATPAPAPVPNEVAPAAPAPQPVQEAPEALPHTASSMPLVGLLGLISMAGFFALRPKRVR